MANTFVKIASSTVGAGGVSSVVFSSIPQTYTDLQVLVSSRADNANVYGWFTYTFNGNSSSLRSAWIEPDGSTVATGSTTTFMLGGSSNGNNSTASTFGNTSIYIPNYTSSNNKPSSSDDVGENNATTSYMDLVANLWSNTSAITSITFVPQTGTGTFRQYSTFTLYGIKNS